MFAKYTVRAHSIILLAMLILLNTVGILILRSASNNDPDIMTRQMIGSVVGVAAALIIGIINYNWLLRYANYIYIAVLVTLLMVLVYGVVRKGAGRWIILPVIGQVQPAEFAKLGLIAFFAAFFERNYERINELRTLLMLAVLIGGPVLMVFVEPNLSTSIIIAVIFLIMLFSCGLSIKYILLFTAVCALAVGLTMLLFSTDNSDLIPFIKDYQKDRILGFLYPEQYSATYFQQGNSIMAIGSGGFFGKGLYNTDIGSVKAGNFLIEEDTDFIFAIIGEELGFRGCFMLIMLYFLIILDILWIGGRSKNIAGAAICIGTSAWIGFQTFTNIAVATAIFPNTGVTLPFISRGASSLLALYMAVGLVLNVGFQSRE